MEYKSYSPRSFSTQGMNGDNSKKTMKNKINHTMKNIKTNYMKNYLLIFVLLLGAVSSWGQTTADQAAVLQKCIDIPELESAYTSAKIEQLVVVQSGLGIPDNLAITKLGKSVLFLTKEAVKGNGLKNYLYIGRWEVGSSKATVAIYFYKNGFDLANSVKIEAELAKTGDTWNIVTSNIERN
jgi:hypothetical protein